MKFVPRQQETHELVVVVPDDGVSDLRGGFQMQSARCESVTDREVAFRSFTQIPIGKIAWLVNASESGTLVCDAQVTGRRNGDDGWLHTARFTRSMSDGEVQQLNELLLASTEPAGAK